MPIFTLTAFCASKYIACGDAKIRWCGMHATLASFRPPDGAPRHHLLSNHKIFNIQNVLQFLIIPYIPFHLRSLRWRNPLLLMMSGTPFVSCGITGLFVFLVYVYLFLELIISVDVLLAKLLSIDTCSMLQYRNTSSAEVQDTDFFHHVLLS